MSKWVVDVTFRAPNGTIERIRKISPVQTRRGAEQYERELREHLQAKQTHSRRRAEKRLQSLAEPNKCKHKVPTLSDFSIEFIANYAKSNNKPSEVSSKSTTFRVHLFPDFGAKRLNEITNRDIEAYKARKLGTGLSPKTINNQLGILGRCLRVAKLWDIIQTVPVIKFLPTPLLNYDFLSFAEADALIAAADDGQWRTMCILALRGGLRLGELRALQWADVDFANN